MTKYNDVTLLVLAGGLARRMNGVNKRFVSYEGRPLIERILESTSRAVGDVLISANRDFDRFKRLGYPVLRDVREGYPGPLGALEAAWRSKRIRTPWLWILPCDVPEVAPNVLRRLYEAACGDETKNVWIPKADGYRQSSMSLIRTSCLASVAGFLDRDEHKLGFWAREQGFVEVLFPDGTGWFLNVNLPEEVR